MLDKKKIAGLIWMVTANVVSTVVTQWMTDRDIETKIMEVLAKHK